MRRDASPAGAGTGLAPAPRAVPHPGAAHAAGPRTIPYRPDIDGLRAVAVSAVVLFHLGVPWLGGGYAGVDVFFVISGYLICGMIDAQIRAGTFSIGRFYERRILRILPALAVMLAAVSLLALRVHLPVELRDDAASLASAAASASNVYFAATARYFDAPALSKPLLHTWSLGVEEQFYLLAPVAFLAVHRFARRALPVLLVAAAALSFCAAVFIAGRNASLAFYLLPCRAWQLLLGALLALGIVPLPAGRGWSEALGGAGLLLVLAAFLAGGDLPALAPGLLAGLGAALVIGSSSRAPSGVGRWLSHPAPVALGLISYSVYLWHWPLIVFQRSGDLLPDALPAGVAQALLGALAIGLGALSWRFVEQPFRAARPPRRAVFAGAAATLTAFGGLSAFVAVGDGLPGRFPRDVARIGAYLAYDPAPAYREGTCYLSSNRQSLDPDACLRLAPDRPNVLLVGDSHAAHFWLGLSRALPSVNLLQATMSECRPFAPDDPAGASRGCARLRDLALGSFPTTAPVDRVLLAASWKDEDVPPLLRTIDGLRQRGVRVVVLGPIVEYDRALPRLLADAMLRARPDAAARSRDATVPVRDRAMRDLVRARGADYVSVHAHVCPDGRCRERATPDVPLQFDTGHLTQEGSLAVGRLLAADPALQPLR